MEIYGQTRNPLILMSTKMGIKMENPVVGFCNFPWLVCVCAVFFEEPPGNSGAPSLEPAEHQVWLIFIVFCMLFSVAWLFSCKLQFSYKVPVKFVSLQI